MQLTGKQIIEENIISNWSNDGVQQQGIDVRLDTVARVDGLGTVPAEGKTILPKESSLVIPISANPESLINGPAKMKYYLTPGYYEVTFLEGCNIPNNRAMYFKTRSSLVRCGSIIHSGQFDGGFHTQKMGAFLEVNIPIYIEKGARVAQMIVNETNEVENIYNGQWQDDKQR